MQWPKGKCQKDKTLHIKLKIEQHESHKIGVNPRTPEGLAVSDPLVAPIS